MQAVHSARMNKIDNVKMYQEPSNTRRKEIIRLEREACGPGLKGHMQAVRSASMNSRREYGEKQA